MSSKDDNLPKRLGDWLHAQGYPLEMRVARAFQKAGFFTIQSEYYDDPQTGQSREIDVVGHVQREFGEIAVRVTCLVECKSSADKPWILFTSTRPGLADPARVAQRAASRLGCDLLDKLCHRKDIQELPGFKVTEHPAHGMTQAFTTGQDVTYSAAASCAAAALALAKQGDEYTQLGWPLCVILFPTVAVEGRLFECYLEGEEMVVSEVESGTLLWRNPVVGAPHTIIHVLTAPAVDEFAAQARSTAEYLLRSCHAELQELAKTLPPGKSRRGSSKRR